MECGLDDSASFLGARPACSFFLKASSNQVLNDLRALLWDFGGAQEAPAGHVLGCNLPQHNAKAEHGDLHNITLPELVKLGVPEQPGIVLVLCCAVLCCAVLCCAVLCCASPSINADRCSLFFSFFSQARSCISAKERLKHQSDDSMMHY